MIHWLPRLENDDLVHRDAITCMANGSDLNAPDEDNHMVNEKGDDNQFVQLLLNWLLSTLLLKKT